MNGYDRYKDGLILTASCCFFLFFYKWQAATMPSHLYLSDLLNHHSSIRAFRSSSYHSIPQQCWRQTGTVCNQPSLYAFEFPLSWLTVQLLCCGNVQVNYGQTFGATRELCSSFMCNIAEFWISIDCRRVLKKNPGLSVRTDWVSTPHHICCTKFGPQQLRETEQ